AESIFFRSLRSRSRVRSSSPNSDSCVARSFGSGKFAAASFMCRTVRSTSSLSSRFHASRMLRKCSSCPSLMYGSPRFGSYGLKPRTGPNSTLDALLSGVAAVATAAGFAAAFGSALLAASCVFAGRLATVREDEVFFFELAGLATTFRFEAGLVFFDVDFRTAAFFLPVAAFFLEVFFEVLFFPDVFVVFRALLDVRPTFLRLVSVLRVVDAFREVFPAVLLLPVFFFFLVAAFLPGINLASKSNYTKPAIIHTGNASGRLSITASGAGQKAVPALLPVLDHDGRVEASADVEIGREAQEARCQTADQIVDDPVRHCLVERAFAAVRPHVELQRFQLDAFRVG